jgi:hypothetical protein
MLVELLQGIEFPQRIICKCEDIIKADLTEFFEDVDESELSKLKIKIWHLEER